MAWRGDPRLGLLKSSLQKGIRRSDLELTASAADGLLGVPGGSGTLARRLRVVAAEDVGWRWLPASDAAITGAADPADLVATALALASVPERNKEAYWLASLCWDGRRVPPVVDRPALTAALDAGDHREALALALAARDHRMWRSGERLIGAVMTAVQDAPAATRRLVDVALEAERHVDSGAAELIAAAVIAAIDRPHEVPTALDVVRRVSSPAVDPLPWFVASDGHTGPGRRAIRRVAISHGLPVRFVTELAFAFESSRVIPAEPPVRWREEARRLDALAYGWGTPEAGERLWGSLRDELRSEVERELGSLR